MADDTFEGEIRIDADAAVRELKKLRGEVNELKEGTKDANRSQESWQTTWNQGLQLFDNVRGKLSEVYGQLKSFGDEFERQAGIINSFNLSVDEASDRVGGLISDIDLLTERNRLMQAGLQLTDKQFADLSVAAAQYAAVTGSDATDAMRMLSNAVVTGGEELIKYGVELGGATSMAEKQQTALEQLGQVYGDVSAGVETLGGRLGQAEVALQNFNTEVITGWEEMDRIRDISGQLEKAWDRLTAALGATNFSAAEHAVAALAGVVGAAAGVLNYFAQVAEAFESGDYVRGVAGVVGSPVIAVVEAAQGAADAIQSSVRGGLASDGPGAAPSAVMTMGRITVGDGASGGRTSSGGGGGGRREREELASLAGLAGGILGDVGGGLGGSLLDATATPGAVGKEQEMEMLLSAQEAMIDAKMREIEATEKLLALEEERFTSLQTQTDQISMMIGDAVFSALEAEESFGKALQGIVVQELKGLARTEAVKSLAAFAAAATRGAFGDVAGAKLLAKAGGIHAAAAAAAGAGAAAIGAAGGGGGGGGRSAADSLGGGRGSGEGGGDRNVTVVFNNPVPLHEVGRIQNRALRAAERRYGDRS